MMQLSGTPLAHLGRDVPRLALVRRSLDATAIDDVDRAVADALLGVLDRIETGQRVAVAVGSRGIDSIAEVTRAVVRHVRGRGALPFVVPAMGSHGGGTAAGQIAVLGSLGVTEASVGCAIRATMDTVVLGTIDGRVPVRFDRIAGEEADAIVPVNRVKLHTDFTGAVESGLLKMLAIGLGKQRGAETLHGEGFAAFPTLLPAAAGIVLSHVNVPFGLALLENGLGRLRRVEAVPGELLLAREPKLRDEAEAYLTRLPTDSLDVLVVDEIGKDVSGLGMDSNVVGRYYTGPLPQGPSIQRIIVRGLTAATHGNATGVGQADVVLQRVLDQLDPVSTVVNAVTARTPEGARVGIVAANDRQALGIALACCVGTRPDAARVLRVRDTKHLDWFWASTGLLDELRDRSDCEVVVAPRPIRFDPAGMLVDGYGPPPERDPGVRHERRGRPAARRANSA
jgi:hypothetical protein